MECRKRDRVHCDRMSKWGKVKEEKYLKTIHI